MNPARFALLKEALLTARRLSPERRDTYLGEVSARNPELRAELESLLARDSASFVLPGDARLESLVEAMHQRPSPAVIPEQVGSYRIVGVLGEGGMGVVYRGCQTEPLRREVAIKLLRSGRDSARIVSRFEAEQQTLALMNHPHIAQALDAGTHTDGSPYFVMELVLGMPVTEYCRDNAVPLPRRLQLFRAICRAVQHAHHKGVIHRDLKPSNLLIATQHDEPMPKVIDFGIAKVMQPDTALPSLTQEGQIIGTLEYMSPEQARGDLGAVDTRSDIYSLAVVLHELITGKLPYDVRGRSLPEAIRIISEEDPASFGRSSVTRGGDGDLETIVRKAMDKSPERRYESAAMLADDIDRFLKLEPILARGTSPAYQFRKLVSRNRLLFAGLTTVMLLLAGFGVVMTVMFERQTLERERTEREALKVSRTNDFLQEMLAASDAIAMGPEVTVREALESAARKLTDGAPEDPELEAAVRVALARTFTGLDRSRDAEAQMRLALAALGHAEGDVARYRATVLDELGAALHYQGKEAAAESSWHEALTIQVARGDEGEMASLLNNLGAARAAAGDLAGAERRYREALALARRIGGDDDEGQGLRLSNLARVVERQGRLDEAEAFFREALAHSRGIPEYNLSFAQVALGRFLALRGHYSEADSLVAAAFAAAEHALRGEVNHHYVMTGFELGTLRLHRGNYASSESLLVAALAAADRVPQVPSRHRVWILGRLGRALSEQGRHDEAESILVRALAEARADGGSESTATALREIAELRRAQHRLDESDSHFAEAEAIYQRSRHPTGREHAMCLLEHGLMLREAGRIAEAGNLLRRSVDGFRAAGWETEWPAKVASYQLALCASADERDRARRDSLREGSRALLANVDSPVPFGLRMRLLGD